MAKTWTALEVLQGWYRHYLAFDEGKAKPVRLPGLKAPRYHKGASETRDLDQEAWARVEEVAGYDSRIPYRLVGQIDRGEQVTDDAFMLALMSDLAQCPFPLDAQEKDPIPESWELRGNQWVPTKEFLEAHVRIGNVWVKRTPEMREGLKKKLTPRSGAAIAKAMYRGRKG